jgi:signal transduction histidine kinase
MISAVINGIVVAGGWALLLGKGMPAYAVATHQLGYSLVALLLTAFTGLAVRYRERLIDSRAETTRLDLLMERLTRANLNYQEYAKSIQEFSIESERKRITRDIHDIVGYTLTNNITMMEAITDTMRTNPLGVPSLVSAARSNSEEGLARVREALHLLRETKIPYPTGLRAIDRLTTVFERATGVDVEFAYSELAWRFCGDIDSALYHVVQESLVNSFRHGKATRVRVFLEDEGARVRLSIKDNGEGKLEYTEGIGLLGMRERIEAVGGTFSARSKPWGFEVSVAVPKERPQDGSHG